MSQEAQVLVTKLAEYFAFMAERNRESPVINSMRQMLSEYAVSGDLKKLKRLEKEINSRIRDTFNDRDKEELKKRWGSDLKAADELAVREIVSKGRIGSEDEFVLLQSFVDQNFSEPALRACIDSCNELLSGYHR